MQKKISVCTNVNKLLNKNFVEIRRTNKFKVSEMTNILKSVREMLLIWLCDALRDLVQFLQFKKRKKHQWRGVTFSKVARFY